MKCKSTSERAIEYILTRSLDDLAVLTVEEIATNLNINRTSMARSIKNEKGFTIEEFITKIKIFRSAVLLKDSETLSIKEVARKMGFCRVDYFIQIFKVYFGTTPLKYRQFMRKNADDHGK